MLRRIILVLTIALAINRAGAQQTIATIVGTDRLLAFQSREVARVASDTPLNLPFESISAVAVDKDGNLYLAEYYYHVVIQVNSRGWRVYAGNGLPGFSGDHGAATNASLRSPAGLAVDPDGNLYIADSGNQRIRRVSVDGTIVTVAGTGTRGFGGDGGSASLATLNNPTGLATDSAGNLFIADTDNHRVRRVSSGVITSVAGSRTPGNAGDNGSASSAQLNYPEGVAIGSDSSIYIADTRNSRVRRVSSSGVIQAFAGTGTSGDAGDGGPALQASFKAPKGLAFLLDGTFLVSDFESSRVRRILLDGRVVTFSGTGIPGYAGDGSSAFLAKLNVPIGLAVDRFGVVMIADRGDLFIRPVVRRVSANGIISTLAGRLMDPSPQNNVPALGTVIDFPQGMAFDSNGNLLFCEGNLVRRVSRDGLTSIVAGTGSAGFSGDGGPAVSATLRFPTGLAIDRSGNIFVADTYNHRIRRISQDGIITTIAGKGTPAFSGDGGSALQAELQFPTGIAFDSQDSLFIADWVNDRIRKIRGGIIDTIAGCGYCEGITPDQNARQTLLSPYYLAFDLDGSLLFTDDYFGMVRRLSSGIITTVAGNGKVAFSGDGGRPTEASLVRPRGLLVDKNGTIYVADAGNHRIRMIKNGLITTIAGTGEASYSGDNGPSQLAALNLPNALASDPDGNLVFGDGANHRVRIVRFGDHPTLFVSPDTIPMTAVSKSAEPATSTFQVTGSNMGLGFSVSVDVEWLNISAVNGKTPAIVEVKADASKLDPGDYAATIAIFAPGATPASRIVLVQFRVTDAFPGVLSTSTNKLSFAVASKSGAANSTVSLLYKDGDASVYSASFVYIDASDWLSVDPSTGPIGTQPVVLNVMASPEGLPSGTYQAVLRVSVAGQHVDIPIVMTVSAADQRILLSQVGLAFTAVAGGGNPLPQSIAILNAGRGILNWSLEVLVPGNLAWLHVSATSGSSVGGSIDVPGIDVAIDSTGLPQGEYTAQIRVSASSADNSPQIIAVVLNVLPSGSNPGPEVRPTGLIFGTTTGIEAGSQEVMISNPLSSPVAFNSGRITYDGNDWFLHAPANGLVVPSQPYRIVVQPKLTGLEQGVRRGVITVLFGDGSVRNINILTVVSSPDPGLPSREKGDRQTTGSCSRRPLNVEITSHRDGFMLTALQPAALQARVVDGCGNPVTSGEVFFAFSNFDPDLHLVHVGDGNWAGTWQPRNLSSPVRAIVTAYLNNPPRLGQRSVSGTLLTGSHIPVVASDSILNAASQQKTLPAPGALLSLKGLNLADSSLDTTTAPYPSQLANTQVFLGDKPLPILYVSDRQINAQVPYDVPINTDFQLIVQNGPYSSVPEQISIAPANPGIFTTDQSGTGAALLTVRRGADWVLPESQTGIRVGDVVRLYCTGLGRVAPQVLAGLPAPDAPRAATSEAVTLSIDGKEAEILFSGLEPSVAGRYIVEFRVPDVSGEGLPVLVRAAGRSSQEGVTVSVR